MKPSPHASGLTHAALPLAASLALVALLFMTHAYTGIRHDSILYFGQALLQIEPSTFEKDLFFEFGSQAQFTIFPRLMAWALEYGTPGQVSMGFTAVGLLLFFAASWALLRTLIPPDARWLAAAGLFTLAAFPSGYGAFSVFSYAEPFVTARSFAEPMALAALAVLALGRWGWAFVIAAIAALLHPLQALPALMVIWIDRALADRRWWWLAAAPFGALVMDLLGFMPFTRYTQRYDPEWLMWIAEPNRNVFLHQWPVQVWGQLAADVFLVWNFARLSSAGSAKRAARALLAAFVMAFTLNWVFAEGLRYVFITGVQLWRVHWLLHWFAMATLPISLWMLWRMRAPEGGWQRTFLLLAVALLGAPAGAYSAALAVPMAIGIYMSWPVLNARVAPMWRAAAFWTIPVAVVIAYLRFAVLLWPGLTKNDLDSLSGPIVLLLHPLPLIFMVGTIGWWYQTRGHSWASHSPRLIAVSALAASVGFFTFAAQVWDQRDSWSRALETHRYEPNPFGVELAADKQVYWYQELITPWLLLHRPSFWNGLQGAGLLFNRGTAQAFAEREKSVGLIEFQGQICNLLIGLSQKKQDCAPETTLLAELCQRHTQRLGYIVMPFVLETPPLATWHVDAISPTDRAVTYRLYSCDSLMAAFPSPPRRAAAQPTPCSP